GPCKAGPLAAAAQAPPRLLSCPNIPAGGSGAAAPLLLQFSLAQYENPAIFPPSFDRRGYPGPRPPPCEQVSQLAARGFLAQARPDPTPEPGAAQAGRPPTP